MTSDSDDLEHQLRENLSSCFGPISDPPGVAQDIRQSPSLLLLISLSCLILYGLGRAFRYLLSAKSKLSATVRPPGLTRADGRD